MLKGYPFLIDSVLTCLLFLDEVKTITGIRAVEILLNVEIVKRAKKGLGSQFPVPLQELGL